MVCRDLESELDTLQTRIPSSEADVASNGFEAAESFLDSKDLQIFLWLEILLQSFDSDPEFLYDSQMLCL